MLNETTFKLRLLYNKGNDLKCKGVYMQIAIDVEDASVAQKILQYLQTLKKDVKVHTLDTEKYLASKQFGQDQKKLHKTLENIQNNPTSLMTLDDSFWDDMDRVIESA